MKNTIDIQSDGTNVWVTFTMRTNGARRLFLTAINIGLVILHAFFIFEIEKHHLKKLLIPTVLSLFVFIFLPWRIWFWQFFGKETIIVNAKALSYQYQYGIFRTHRRTIAHRNLRMRYEPVKKYATEEYGKLQFISLNEKTNRPDYIYETTVLVSREELNKLRSEIVSVFDSGGERLAS